MPTTDRLRGILDLVESSLDEPELTGDDLAARAYLSRFHFDRLVSAAIGEPPGTFRRRLLLERAAHRLVGSDDPVTDVAYASGYGSPEAFARAFARAYGEPPSAYRHTGRVHHRLPGASGIHFNPPGGLRLPALTRSTTMDVLTRMLDHHLWLVGQIIDRMDRLDDTTLDRPIELSVEGIDDNPTLRSLGDRLVGQLEMWVGALEGATSMPPEGDRTAAGLGRRLEVVAPRFRALVVAALDEGRAEETFVDAVCDPPETFTYAGVIAHVLTFSAVRRTLAVGALETAGISDLGSGDPMQFVGGSGSDASQISRTPAR
ncbi:helix-turn-helix domain-containing protein [Solicola gregarius]|uniref:AraC family transcriptional regulator n=1 Tax=Solicola gregarius TaxID=2908642 RepID=A0AA46TE72_9ACTN|nr:AraC family transcriptional regulator [Solicola gregarius]UYM03580.1 AraC family transcriptional regulator [Solicola gregarius]